MIIQTLSDAKILSEKIAGTFAAPRFYREKKTEIRESLLLFENNPIVTACIEIITARVNFSGHGLSHARKVAIDAGTIILIEGRHTMEADNVNRSVALAHIAGILHDIKRSSKNHARRGAEEAKTILRKFDLTDKEQTSVVNAIGNHEAFQSCTSIADPDAQLLSDALYDADKFRWGPDNFTEMIWDISDTFNIPIEILLDHFPAGGYTDSIHGKQSLRRQGITFIQMCPFMIISKDCRKTARMLTIISPRCIIFRVFSTVPRRTAAGNSGDVLIGVLCIVFPLSSDQGR